MMGSAELSYPFQIAKRYQNQKRAYLLVNALQGKHIPVSPKDALALFSRLGKLLHEKYPAAKLVIGFAETATAIAAGTAAEIGDDCVFLTTTRAAHIEDGACVCFEERHSHLTAQKLYTQNFREILACTNEILVIDDEISSGRTVQNLIEALRAQFPETAMHPFIVGSVLNRVPPEQKRKCAEQHIYFEQLYEALPADYAEDVRGDDFSAPEEAFSIPVSFRGKACTLPFPEFRRSVSMGDYLTFCARLSDLVMTVADFTRYDTVLVLGTEECMYPSIFAARRMERECGCAVYCHSTTASPIACSREKGYPIQNGFRLPSVYDENRDSYLYNLRKYDAAVIVSDVRTRNGGLGALEALLSSYQIQHQFYFTGE